MRSYTTCPRPYNCKEVEPESKSGLPILEAHTSIKVSISHNLGQVSLMDFTNGFH